MRRGSASRVARSALLALPIVILAAGAWHSRWMSDDGFVNLRAVSQIAAGNGPVFNAGERVEATTSPLWVFLLTAGDVLVPLRLEWIAVLGGMALTVSGLALAIWGSVRLQRGTRVDPLWIPAGALVLAVFAPMWRFSTSGLETGVTFAWLGGCLALLAVWAGHDRRLGLGAAFVIGLGPLVRPELSLVSLLLVASVLAAQWRSGRWRDRLALVGAAFALPVAYQIFRMGYYGSLVPNTAFAKEATRAYWSAGLTYLRKTVVDSYALWLPIAALVAGAYGPLVVELRRRGGTRGVLVVAAFGVAAFVEALYVVRVGGDFMDNRFLLPALFLLLAPVAVVPAERRFLGAMAVVPWALVALVTLRGPEDGVPRAFATGVANPVTTVDFGMARGGSQLPFSGDHGVYYLRHRLPGAPSAHDPALATYGVGAPSYALGTDVYVLDLFGLGDPFTSHLRLDRRGTVAHEKPLPHPWIPARLLRAGAPVTARDVAKPLSFLARALGRPDGQSFAERVRDARRALRCSRLRDFFATYRAPLDAGRFFENLADAFTNNGFRIPPEPRDALGELC
jgi:arabinofuranosyltransferase